MTVATCWMPDQSLREERAARPLGKVLDEWSKTWLVDQRCAIAGGWRPADQERDGCAVLRDSGPWQVSGEKNAVMLIAYAMLGEAERTDLAPADLRLLRRVASEAIDDLAEKLEAILPKHPGVGGGWSDERWILEICLAGKSCLELSLDRSTLSLMVRQTYPARAAAPSLERISTALEGVSVTVAARLGTSNLDLEQIASLEPGDVLLLDQTLGEPLALAVAGRSSPLRCALTQSEEALSLTVCELP